MSYTSHAIQLFYMSCNFSHSKHHLKGEKIMQWLEIIDQNETTSCWLGAWIKHSSKNCPNIILRFKVTWMWSLNPRAMNDKILPYNYLFRWKNTTLMMKLMVVIDGEMNLLLHLSWILHDFSFAIDGNDSNCLLSPNQIYHVEMPRSPTTIKRLQEVDEPNWFTWTMNSKLFQ